jgi:tetratricopeptide (TPR) repeat protein
MVRIRLAVATLLVLLQTSASADPSSAAIDRAQKLLLEGHRTAAVELIVKALKKENSPRARARLTTTLNAISQQFLTEKGQRLYEAGLTLQKGNAPLALQRFFEAAVEEDSNVLVTVALAQTLILQKRCQEAKSTVDSAIVINPVDTELLDLHVRVALCLNDRDGASQDLRVLEKTEFPQWRLRWLRGQLLESEGSPASRLLLEQVIKEVPKFPEAFLALWRWPQITPEQREEFGKKYVSACKGLSVRARQDFRFEPELCLHSEEVQAELDKEQKHWDDLSDK